MYDCHGVHVAAIGSATESAAIDVDGVQAETTKQPRPLSTTGIEALVKAEEEKLIERQKIKEEKKQKIENAKAKALK